MRIESSRSSRSGPGQSGSHAVREESVVRGVGERGRKSCLVEGIRKSNCRHSTNRTLLFLRYSGFLGALFRGGVTLEVNLQLAALSIGLV